MITHLPRARHSRKWGQMGLRKHFYVGFRKLHKTSGGNRIPGELLQILKENAAEVLHSTCQQIWKTRQFQSQEWKRSVFIPVPKNAQTTAQLHSFHMLSRSWSKSFKLGFISRWTKDFQKFKMDLEKAEESEIKLSTSTGSRKSKRIPEKHLCHWLS